MVTRFLARTLVVVVFALSGCGGTSESGGDTSAPLPDLVGGGETTVPGDVAPGGDSTPPGRDAGAETVLPPQAECVHDEDCGAEKVCDCLYKCLPRPTDYCNEDVNCGTGRFCDPCTRQCHTQYGLCEPCLSESRCDLATGFCEPTGAQCGSPGNDGSSRCLDFANGNSYCGFACVNNFGCPAGFECVDAGGTTKQCVPFVRECGSNADCESDSECPYGEICEATFGTCRPGCQDDDQCGNGQVCSGFRCAAPCDPVNNPCPEGEECAAGHCKIPGSCRDKYDCEEIETYCDPTTHMCAPGCLEDFDCKRSAYACVDGHCEKKPCEHNWYCAFEQVCDKGNGECKQAEGPHCDTCDPQQEKPCGEGNECITLQDKDGNELGSFCFVKCEPGEQDRCPQGYQCTPLQDEGGQVQNEVCTRDCSKPPVGL